jgi:hypothetical protein
VEDFSSLVVKEKGYKHEATKKKMSFQLGEKKHIQARSLLVRT